ncbi:MAG: thiamine-phosphate kinase [Thermoplasmata archaeon]|nr:thiamine-phosphate kinase [Candidatus Sysuiplasma acidicola]
MLRHVFKSPPSPAGMGDDCAVVKIGRETLLFTSDMLTESAHFRYCRNPEQKGRMAMAVNLSDIAAMGGKPEFALVSIGIPHSMCRTDVIQFARGIARAAEHYGVRVLGGDTKSAYELTASITVCGKAIAKPMLRSGARSGDYLAVTGKLGGASCAYYALNRGLSDNPGRLCNPVPRVAEGMKLAESGAVTAAMDITDGLALSAWYVSRASGVSIDIDRGAIPVDDRLKKLNVSEEERENMLLYWGGDYELLFTVSRDSALSRLRKEKALDFTVIGRVKSGSGVHLLDGGQRRKLNEEGYDSLAQGTA